MKRVLLLWLSRPPTPPACSGAEAERGRGLLGDHSMHIWRGGDYCPCTSTITLTVTIIVTISITLATTIIPAILLIDKIPQRPSLGFWK